MVKNRYTRKASNKAKWSSNDVFNIISSFVGISSFFVGVLALYLTYIVSKQQQRIDGFEKLLSEIAEISKSSKKVDSSLTIQIEILNNQLAIGVQEQKIVKENSEISYASHVYRLYTTSYALIRSEHRHTKILLKYPDELPKQLELDKALLQQEINNPFLLKNKHICSEWLTAYQMLSSIRIMGYGTGMTADFDKDGKQINRLLSNKEIDDMNFKEVDHYVNFMRNVTHLAYNYSIAEQKKIGRLK